MTTAVVVGSGPNGLAAAVVLARAGLDVTVLEASDTPGGGARTVEATLPGLLHDECSGFHPLAVGSAYHREHRPDVTWAWPEVQFSHPLDGGRGGAAYRDVEETADGLGEDAAAYRRLFGPLTRSFGDFSTEFLQPIVHVPRHPVALARFGLRAALPATTLARRWRSDEARGLWAGAAAHAFRPLDRPVTSAIGLALATSAHHTGWPVAVGGSGALTAASLRLLEQYGGRVETGVHVTDLRQCEADVVVLDTSPRAAADICGDAMPARVRRAYRRYRHGPAAYQVALAVEGGIPWAHEPSRRAGTVHVGGTLEQVADAEGQVWRGRMPERPFVLLGQQYLADPSRSVGDVHPVDAYAHVPAGYDGDATELLLAQVERFAPGFRERVVATTVRPTRRIEADNHNYVGGDIVTGANTVRQLVLRPRATLSPYATGARGVWLCSAATPPGAGAHGMCGYLAGRAVLDHLGRSSALTVRSA